MAIFTPYRDILSKRSARQPHEPIKLVGVHGTPEFPIVIRDLTIDGLFNNKPLWLRDCSYLILENIRAINGSKSCVYLDSCEDIAIRDVEAHNATDGFNDVNAKVFWLYRCRNVLVEDCSGGGWCRKVFEPYRSEHIVVRRFHGKWNGCATSGSCVSLGYYSRHLLFEDIVADVELQCATGSGSAGLRVERSLPSSDGISADIVLRNSRSRFLIGEGGSTLRGRAISAQTGVGHGCPGGIEITGLTVETDDPGTFGLYLDHRPGEGAVPNVIRGTRIQAERNYCNWRGAESEDAKAGAGPPEVDDVPSTPGVAT